MDIRSDSGREVWYAHRMQFLPGLQLSAAFWAAGRLIDALRSRILDGYEI